MADVILSAELQARVDSFVANLLAAANSADNTSNSVSQMSTNISRNVANVNRVNLSQFTAAMNAGTLSVQRFNNTPLNPRPVIVGANRATQSLTDFGRILQDLPYGIQGVANNFNPAIESFQRLQRETGSTSAALRALGGSLLEPAGIGIAISAISSLLIYYTQYQQRANKATKDAKKNNDDYVKSLDAVTASSLKGAQNAQKDLTNLNLLYQAYTNANLPLKARKEAYSELQSQYPSYFTNLKFEKEASEKTANAYNLLTQEILASARARAASDKISQNESRKLENEQKEVDLRRERIKLLQTQDKLQRAVDAGIGSAERGDSSGAQEAIDLLRVNKQVAENQSLINNLKTDTNLLDEQNGRLVSYVNSQLEKGGKLVGGFGDKIKEVKKELQKTNTNQLGGLNQDVGSLLGIGSSQEFTIKPRLKIEPIITGLSQIQKEADAWNEKFANTIQNGFGNTLSTIGDSIGAALQNGGDVVNAIGTSILSGFGNFLSQFGDLLIEYGAAAILKGKLDLAIAVPGAGIAAGFAAVAAGLALKIAAGAIGSFVGGKGGKGSGVTAFANGGIISGPTLGLMGEYAGAKSDPEVVAPLSKLKNLLGETDEAGNITSKGNFNVEVNQSIGLGLNELVAKIDRVRITRNRQG